MKRFSCYTSLGSLALGLSIAASAQDPQPPSRQLSIPIHAVSKEGIGDSIGRIVVTEFPGGLEFRPALTGLQHGLHGFHVHENPDCSPGRAPESGGMVPAKAAGGHWDPANAAHHDAPWEDGHYGDLPALYADRDNVAEHPVFKPNMKLEDLPGHALIVHHGSDNYKDDPVPSGGGGPAMACGVIPPLGN
ncbi:superoxide dismutase family protein [Proteobacteria bacterium 005FR1]|nr:superoxide dismutase family protein [Proteobacteria bacterium 005FR1]